MKERSLKYYCLNQAPHGENTDNKNQYTSAISSC